MKKLLIAASTLAFAVGLSAPAFAETKAPDCQAMFAEVDANDNGWVDGAEAKPFLDAIKKAGLESVDANTDGFLNVDEFIEACEKGAFKDLAK